MTKTVNVVQMFETFATLVALLAVWDALEIDDYMDGYITEGEVVERIRRRALYVRTGA